MSNVLRAFIAIAMPVDVQKGLNRVSQDLQNQLKGVPVRWVRAEGIHLTLKFLGDVSIANLEVLKNMLKAEVDGHHPFELKVGELGAFPSLSRPRVLWIKVEAPAELRTVQYGIETQAARLGYDREERPFSPHLTLGRVARNATPEDMHRISDVLKTYQVGSLGSVRVQAIDLYSSDMRPTGAVYTCLFSAGLSSIE